MRWLFTMIEETEGKYKYTYSRESDNLDGVIEYSKEQKIITMVKPCSIDDGSEWCVEKAIEKFAVFVVGEDFPASRRVITG